MSQHPTSSPAADRYCPTCGLHTAVAFCPDDGVATVSWARFSKAPGAYQAGDVVGDRYRIRAVLGRGGYGSVYEAVHTGTRQHIAIKMLDFDPREAGEVVLRRFYKEAQVTAGLQHPNTVRIFDVGQDAEGPFFIAMELLEGPNLADVMKRALKCGQAMPERQAVQLCIDVLHSLQEAHDKQLVHRDLKPANIIFAHMAGTVVVKVLDFGIARTQDSSLTGSGMAPGTPVFMSPEQCRGQSVDARSDIYAVGIMLYLCSSGRLPFFSQKQVDMMAMHINEPVPDPRGRTSQPLSEATAIAALRALAKAPGDRFQSANEMIADLEAALAALPAGRPGEFPPASVAPLAVEERAPASQPVVSAAKPGFNGPTQVVPRPGRATGEQRAPVPESKGDPVAPVLATPGGGRTRLAFALGLLLGVVLGAIAILAFREQSADSPAATADQIVPAAPATNPGTAGAADTQTSKITLLREMASGGGPLAGRVAFAEEALRLAPGDPDIQSLLVDLRRQLQARAQPPAAAAAVAPTPAPPPDRPVRRKRVRATAGDSPSSANPAVMD